MGGEALHACGELTATDVEVIRLSASRLYESRILVPLDRGVSIIRLLKSVISMMNLRGEGNLYPQSFY